MHSLKGKKILIVEDDEMLRDILCDIFTSAEAEVIQATNGLEAISVLQKNKIDAVMTDMNMHGGDGISLVGNIKALPTPHPAIFICTGFNQLAPQMVKNLGIVKIFEKPFDKDDLITTLSQHLNSKSN